MKKKLVCILTISLMVLLMGTVSAFAASKTVCPVSKCTKTYTHKHQGKSYAGHHANDKHKYHAKCNVSNCKNLVKHSHKHNGGNGHGYGHGHGNGNHH